MKLMVLFAPSIKQPIPGRLWHVRASSPDDVLIYGVLPGREEGFKTRLRRWTADGWEFLDYDLDDPYREASRGGVYLWNHGPGTYEHLYESFGRTNTSGDTPLWPGGYDGPDNEHIYAYAQGPTGYLNRRGGFGGVMYARFDLTNPTVIHDDGSIYYVGESFIQSDFDVDDDDDGLGGNFSYQEFGGMCYSNSQSMLYQCGTVGQGEQTGSYPTEVYTFHDRPAIARSVPIDSGGSFTENMPGSVITEWIGDVAPVDMRVGGTAIRELQDGTMLCTVAGQVGIEPLLMKRADSGDWFEMSPAPPTTGYATHRVTYLDVDGVADDDFWVVGQGTNGGVDVGLLLHWNGLAWTQHFIPANWYFNYEPFYGAHFAGIPGDGVTSIDVIATDDAWIVGAYNGGVTLAAHWDGSSWTVRPVTE